MRSWVETLHSQVNAVVPASLGSWVVRCFQAVHHPRMLTKGVLIPAREESCLLWFERCVRSLRLHGRHERSRLLWRYDIHGRGCDVGVVPSYPLLSAPWMKYSTGFGDRACGRF
mmetsp:Transcript_122390/g.391302  ORF Transcript_122390/g.391302 Transcript_122390/m.391302 type:complete len:114 (+) Transcript_122390:2799-3140(+)